MSVREHVTVRTVLIGYVVIDCVMSCPLFTFGVKRLDLWTGKDFSLDLCRVMAG